MIDEQDWQRFQAYREKCRREAEKDLPKMPPISTEISHKFLWWTWKSKVYTNAAFLSKIASIRSVYLSLMVPPATIEACLDWKINNYPLNNLTTFLSKQYDKEDTE